MHALKKDFTEAGSSERIRRTLRKQLRPTNEKYEMGDKVTIDFPEWK